MEYVSAAEKKRLLQARLKDKFLNKKPAAAAPTAEASPDEEAGGAQEEEEELEACWVLPRRYREMDLSDTSTLRKRKGIEISGSDCPPVCTFEEMRLPTTILSKLGMMGITKPTEVQMQCIPLLLQRRNVVAAAPTGTGKTLAFALPLVMLALEQHVQLQVEAHPNRNCFDGPLSIVVSPSRELTCQTKDVIQELCTGLETKMRVVRIAGGTNVVDFMEDCREGVHIMTACPGKLIDFVRKGVMFLNQCTTLVLDEADKLLDRGFSDEIKSIIEYLPKPHQLAFFSSSLPRKALSLHKPVTVLVEAGGVSSNVIQCIEEINDESAHDRIVRALKKTKPPALVFVDNIMQVEDMVGYLTDQGISAIPTHQGMNTDDRLRAIDSFKSGKYDVLVATDIIKGLDLNVRHVINLEMPRDIDTYVHRIGRTGRGGVQGLATTYISNNCEEYILSDLMAVLVESEQTLPPFLRALPVPTHKRNVYF